MAVNGGDEFPSLDARGIPTPICPACGCDWLVVPVKFWKETYMIGMWGTEGYCYQCKTEVTACTPKDLPWEMPNNPDGGSYE